MRAARLLLLAGAVVVLAACYLTALRAPAVGAYHDDGVYLVTAKALAEGHGYEILSLPDPLPQTKYPILFPLLLSLTWRLAPAFPANALALKLVPLAAALLWCGLAFVTIERETDRRTAAWIAAFTAASPWVMFLSTTLLSETTFAAWCWGALAVLGTLGRAGVVRAGTGPADAGRAVVSRCAAAGVLAGASVLTRTVGLALVPAAALWLLVRAGRRESLVFTACAAVVAVPWFWWSSTAASAIPADAGYYSAANYLDWTVVWNFGWLEKLTVVIGNMVQAWLAPGRILGVPDSALVPLGILCGLLMAVGLSVRVRSGVTALDVFFVFYLGLLLAWPWPPTRFLVPVYPLLLLYVWTGVRRTLAALAAGERARTALASAAVAATVVLAGHGILQARAYAARSGISWPVASCEDRWSDYRALSDWIRRQTPERAVLVSTLDPLFYLYTGRKAQRAFSVDPVELYYLASPHRRPLGPPSRLAERILAAGADYLVDAPVSCFGETPFLRRQIRALRERDPEALAPAASEGPWARWLMHADRGRLAAIDR